VNRAIGTLTFGGFLAMVDRVDLLIAVIGIVASVVGSSTALWIGLSKKPDREDLVRHESRFEKAFQSLESTVAADLNRVESKLDALILRLVPERLPEPGT
jgi:hypothetical protein